MRRLLPLLAAALVLLLAPGARADDVTPKALTFDVMVGDNGDIPCAVNADLYTPAGASRANPAAAVLATNGFGGSKTDFRKLGSAYAKRGYVFLAYSGLGFGGSGCKITLDDRARDGKAGSQLVSFLGGTKAARDGTTIDSVQRDGPGDPRVGMIGGSYGGQIQFAIAAQDPRMDALVPQITWNDLSYSLTPNNTDFERGVTYRTPGVSKVDWPVLFFGLGVGQGIEAAFTDPSHLGSCPNFDDRVCAALVQSGSTGYPDDSTLSLLRGASVTSYMDKIRIPTLLAQGQHDSLFDLQEATATYQALRAQGTPVKMLWRSAGHSGGGLGTRENDEANPEAAYESRMELEWLDYYLRGLGDRPTLDFSFLREWALPKTGDAAPSVGRAPAYPAGTDRTYLLSGSDALVPAGSPVAAGSASMAAVPGAPSSAGGDAREAGAADAPGTSVAFASGPLAEDTDVVGIPRVTVRVSAPTFALSQGTNPGGKLVLIAKLYDQDAAGTSTLPKNLVSQVRVADVTKPIAIELPGIVHRFAKGHRLRLVLATSNVTSRGNNVGGPVTVTVDPAAPSPLTVPVLGAPTGTTPDGFTAFAGAPQARRCASRRAFRIRLHRAPRGDRVRSATVTVNGRRVEVVRGAKRLRAPVDLRGLPKGTFRVVVTLRTRKGRTLRTARTYRTCTPKRR
jgi:predicted acyl esterase